MIRVFTGEMSIVNKIPHLEILYPNLGKSLFFGKSLLKPLVGIPNKPLVEIVSEQQADFFLFPYDYNFVLSKPVVRNMFENFIYKARKLNKPLIVFFMGDLDIEFDLTNAVIFRVSSYRFKIKKNEIIVPWPIEDLGKKWKWEELLRPKTEKPTVGFCGFAQLTNPRHLFSYWIKNLYFEIKSVMSKNDCWLAKRGGIYFRQKAISILKASNKIENNFIIRDYFSGHTSTISKPFATLRDEYIRNLIRSDIILSVKGSGNYSLRFYETLSMGRIPLFIDSESVLPLEETIDYDSFIIRVNFRNLENLVDRAIDFWNSLTPEAYHKKQLLARQYFDSHLNFESCLRILLQKEFLLKKCGF